MSAHAFKNGEPIAPSLLLERGFVYGDGFFETMRVASGEIPLLPYHIERALHAADTLKIPLNESKLRSNIASLLRELTGPLATACILKVMVCRAESGRGSYPTDTSLTNIFALIRTLPEGSQSQCRDPVGLISAKTRLPTNSMFAGLKLMARLEYSVAAQIESVGANEELLFLDKNEHLIETMHHNLFWVSGNVIKTPSLNGFGVKGVMRLRVINQIAQQMSLCVEEGCYDMAELIGSDFVFITNAVEGVVQVNSIDGAQCGHSAVFTQLQMLANKVFPSS